MKLKNNIKSSTFKTLGKKEASFLFTLKKNKVTIFDVSEAEKITEFERQKIYQLLFNLKRKGWIREIEGGKYVLSISGSLEASLFSVATNLVWPSYISFWSALNFYGFTEQVPRMITVVTTKRKKEVEFKETSIKFIVLSPKRFFGYTRVEDFVIAEKEKAIIDSLLFPRYAGGMGEICKAIYFAKDEISFEKLVNYAIRIKNNSVVKRLGYFFKVLNIKLPKSLIELMKKNIGKGFSLLDPSCQKTNKYDREWFLILNVSKKDLLNWRRIY